MSGADSSAGIVAASTTGVKVGRGLRSKWGGSELRSRVGGKALRQGNGWVVEGSDGYASYAGTPTSNGFSTPGYSAQSALGVSSPGYVSTPNSSAVGLGFPSIAFGPSDGTLPSSPLPSTDGRSYSGRAGLPPRTPNTGAVSLAPPSSGLASVPGTTSSAHANIALALPQVPTKDD